MYRTFKYQIFLVLVLAAAAMAQGEATRVNRSLLTGTNLPAGAQRVNEGHVPAKIDQTLQKIIEQGGPGVRSGEKEVLIWTGADLRKAGGKSVINSLTGMLSSGGWTYEVAGTADGITLFTALKDGESRRAVIGFYGEMDGTLMVAWTEIHSAAGDRPQMATPSANTDAGSVADYIFTTPNGWSRNDSAGRITLTKGDDKSIVFLPLAESSGSLDRDAERILWQVYKGYGPWSGNGFQPDYGTFERGKTVQGLEYFRAYRYAIKNGDTDTFPQSRFDAVILVVKVGAKVAVIAGRAPFQSDYASDSALSAIDLILYDLRLKSAGGTYDVKSEMLGSWSAASGSVGLAYTFNANGTFNKGGAIQFRTSHDATRDKVTTTSYGMSDTYSLSGNVITTNYKRTGEAFRYKVRIYETKYDKDAWQQKLGFLSAANPDGGTIVFRKSN